MSEILYVLDEISGENRHFKNLLNNWKHISEDLERILTDEGCKLRMNRSIQAEGSFAYIKADMSFRRYLCKGLKNVLGESILLAMAHNINKLDSKIQSGSTGRHLFELKKAA